MGSIHNVDNLCVLGCTLGMHVKHMKWHAIIGAYKFFTFMKEENDKSIDAQGKNEQQRSEQQRSEKWYGSQLSCCYCLYRVVETRIFKKNLGQNHNNSSTCVCECIKLNEEKKRREKSTQSKMNKTDKGKQNFIHMHKHTDIGHGHKQKEQKICKTESRYCRLLCRHSSLFPSLHV